MWRKSRGKGNGYGTWRPNESYYAPELMQSNLLRRLVMYGVGIDSKADVPMGDIHGIAKEAGQYQHRLVPLGMTNLNRTAISQ